jgi:hypothetical protein
VTVEERLRSGLASLVEPVRPMPDPWGRLLARARRRRHTRRMLGALTAVLLVFFGTLVPAGFSDRPPGPFDGYAYWSKTIIDGKPRGSVAAQTDFVAELTRLITDEVRAGTNDPALNGFHDEPPSPRRVRVLFAEDVEQRRVVLVAVTGNTSEPFLGTVLVWIEGPRGAAPAYLAEAVAAGDGPADVSFSTSDAQPFLTTTLDLQAPVGVDASIAVAPPGCSIETAASPALSDWRPEPTGSYIIRTAATTRAEWWRVTCDGVIRHVRPAPPAFDPASRDRLTVTDEEVQRAVADTSGSADRDQARRVLSILVNDGGYTLTARPSVVWGGRVAGVGGPGTTMVVVAPVIGGGLWIGVVDTALDRPDPDRPGLGFGSFTTAADPTHPSTLLAIPLEPEPHTAILVIAPQGTAMVRAIDRGQRLVEAMVTERGTLLTIPADADLATLRVDAIDADGALIATTAPAQQGLQTGEQANWD